MNETIEKQMFCPHCKEMASESVTSLQKKIDFAVIIKVKGANPNGDPLNGNRPRTDYNGIGEISDVCLKRKIRDRMQEEGHSIFVQSDDRKKDKAKSLRHRAESEEWGLGPQAFKFVASKSGTGKKGGKKSNGNISGKQQSPTAEAPEDQKQKVFAARDETAIKACRKWDDVRFFGQLFAWQGGDEAGSVSIGIRGPVTLQSAFSLRPIEERITSIQITKSVSSDLTDKVRGSDTMGMKHRVDQAIYVAFGSINPKLAERTLMTDADAETIKELLRHLFRNDASSARPEGTMQVLKVVWCSQSAKDIKHSSARLHEAISVDSDSGTVSFKEGSGQSESMQLPGVECEILDGE